MSNIIGKNVTVSIVQSGQAIKLGDVVGDVMNTPIRADIAGDIIPFYPSAAYLSGHLASGAYISYSFSRMCHFCRKTMDGNAPRFEAFNVPLNTFNEAMCADCLDFDASTGQFIGRAIGRLQGIREGCPLSLDTPLPILADWLFDQGKTDAANFVRSMIHG